MLVMGVADVVDVVDATEELPDVAVKELPLFP